MNDNDETQRRKGARTQGISHRGGSSLPEPSTMHPLTRPPYGQDARRRTQKTTNGNLTPLPPHRYGEGEKVGAKHPPVLVTGWGYGMDGDG
jgi:hypothetical protein